jgi:hypothetical protein
VLAAVRGEPLLQLGDCPVDLRQVLRGVRGKRAVELAQRLRGRQRARPLDHLPLELAAHVALELLELLARHGVRIAGLGAARLALQA